jgi:DNA-binding response OmpR family regulator
MNQPATILIVDDLDANRLTLMELLAADGFHLVEAADGGQALELAAAMPPDLVLLDVMMPGMDGYEVCRRLRADARLAEVPVVLVTALDDQAARLTGIEAGADDFISKPFNRTELRARVRTITRLNRYRRLTETQQQLLHSQRLENVGMLAAGIAHDINNALLPIILSGPVMRSYVKDPGGLRLLGIVESCAERGSGLVRQLLSFARGTGDKRELLQARHILKELDELVQSTFPKSIRVRALLPAELWPIKANPTQIHQVFLNLCVNARDAMPQGGDLTITAENRTLDATAAAAIADGRSGSFLTVEVRDTGTGIPPDVLAKIWEPFFSTKEKGRGTGLGLSTVRGIVNQHAGFVTVQTQAGRGTAFTVYLPAAESAEVGGSRPAAAPFARGKGELVLVADDDQSVRLVVAQILTTYGYRVILACDGADAIVQFATRATDVKLLITDMLMPVMGGAALATALRRLNPALPIVATSATSSQPDSAHLEFTTAFLAKPFQTESLLAMVRRTLDEAGPQVVAPDPTPTPAAT